MLVFRKQILAVLSLDVVPIVTHPWTSVSVYFLPSPHMTRF